MDVKTRSTSLLEAYQGLLQLILHPPPTPSHQPPPMPSLDFLPSPTSPSSSPSPTEDFSERLGLALRTLLAYVSNVLAHPQDAKYRQVGTANKAFNARVASIPEALKLFVALGFEEEAKTGNNGETPSDSAPKSDVKEEPGFWVLREFNSPTEQSSFLETAKQMIEQLQRRLAESKSATKQATQASPIAARPAERPATVTPSQVNSPAIPSLTRSTPQTTPTSATTPGIAPPTSVPRPARSALSTSGQMWEEMFWQLYVRSNDNLDNAIAASNAGAGDASSQGQDAGVRFIHAALGSAQDMYKLWQANCKKKQKDTSVPSSEASSSEVKSAAEAAEKKRDEDDENEDTFFIGMLANLQFGKVLCAVGKYTEAIPFLKKAHSKHEAIEEVFARNSERSKLGLAGVTDIEIYEKTGIVVYLQLGKALNKQSLGEQAEAHLRKCVALTEAAEDEEMKMHALRELAQSFLPTTRTPPRNSPTGLVEEGANQALGGGLSTALQYYQEALAVARRIGHQQMIIHITNTIGMLDLDRSVEGLKARIPSTSNLERKASFMLLLASALMEKGHGGGGGGHRNLREAFEWLEKSMQTMLAAGGTEMMVLRVLVPMGYKLLQEVKPAPAQTPATGDDAGQTTQEAGTTSPVKEETAKVDVAADDGLSAEEKQAIEAELQRKWEAWLGMLQRAQQQ